MPSNYEDASAALASLVAQLQAATPGRTRRGRGRPNTDIRRSFVRLEIYVEPALHAALSRLAERMAQRTGKSTARSHIVRAALRAYVQQHLPEAGV
jgi:hypothetical protein